MHGGMEAWREREKVNKKRKSSELFHPKEEKNRFPLIFMSRMNAWAVFHSKLAAAVGKRKNNRSESRRRTNREQRITSFLAFYLVFYHLASYLGESQ